MAYESYVLVCGGTACMSGGAQELFDALIEGVKAAGLADRVQVVRTGCLGFCEKGPIVKILPEGTFYVSVKAEDAMPLIELMKLHPMDFAARVRPVSMALA